MKKLKVNLVEHPEVLRKNPGKRKKIGSVEVDLENHEVQTLYTKKGVRVRAMVIPAKDVVRIRSAQSPNFFIPISMSLADAIVFAQNGETVDLRRDIAIEDFSDEEE